MGILDSMFGGGQAQTQGPQSPGILSRMQAQYAPGAYEAVQQAQRQRAVYDAAMQSKDMSPQVAQALAMSPQFFGAQQGSYLPQPTQVTPINQPDGGQTLVQTSNPGGGAGHGLSMSGLPITEPPGTTTAPARAAGAAPPPDAQGSPAQAPNAQPTNTLQGMPGSTQAVLKQIEANKAAGLDPTAGIPEYYKGMATAVLEGRETLKDITSQRGAPTKNIINAITQAIDPQFDESMNEARNVYRKGYVSGKATDIGGQVKSLNKLSGHANAMADAATNIDNVGMGGASILARPINALGNVINSTPKAGLQRAADLYNNELSTYVSGKGGSGVEERKERTAAFDPNATPQQLGQTLLTDIDFLEKQMEGNEQHRNAVWGDKQAQKFPLVSPQALEQLNQAKIKAHKLVGDYDEWSKSPEGQKAGVSPKGADVNLLKPGDTGLPPGWKVVK